MNIHEPATLVTDVLLAALAGWCAWRLARQQPAANRPARRFDGLKAPSLSRGWWSGALALTAASAFVGGLYHGLAPNFPTLAGAWWKLTLLLLGLVSAAMALALAHEWAPASLRRWRLVIGTKFALAAGVMLAHPVFVVAIVDYGLVLVAWAVAALLARRGWSGWMLAGIAFSVVAAAIQQLHWGLSPRFNHNDVYHVIQALALYAFYRAGLKLGGTR